MLKHWNDKESKASESYTVVPVKSKPPFSERLTRNAALGALILLCVMALSTSSSSGKGLIAAVQNSLDEDWDEQLGRLTFVTNMFPDTVQVFFSSSDKMLCAPCLGSVVHAWTKAEPYVGYGVYDENVYPSMSGEVVGIGHGENEERIVRISHNNGLETVYYNLSVVHVTEGEQVTSTTPLGTALKDHAVYLEVRQDGVSIDPTAMLRARSPL